MLTKDFLRSRRQHQMSAEERQALESAIVRVDQVPARKTLIRRGEPVRHSTLLLEGFASRYMDARDGYRQLLCLHVPGDFIDLHSFPLQRLDHDVGTLSEVRLGIVPHEALVDLCDRYPHLARLLWFSTLLDAALHREWIFRMGRLEAMGRIAHFICETRARMAAVGRVDGDRFELPLTQQDLGEVCGLTSVHVNRTLKRLREDGLVEIARGKVHIMDLPRLTAMGEFDPDYLFCDGAEVTP